MFVKEIYFDKNNKDTFQNKLLGMIQTKKKSKKCKKIKEKRNAYL